MDTYKNLSGISGVRSYEIGDDYIKVRFKNSLKTYKYSHRRPGKIHVDRMKLLALSGRGLSTYINQHVRENYDKY